MSVVSHSLSMSYLSVCIENDEYVLLSLLLFLSKHSILSCPATRKTFEISDLSIYNQGVKSVFRSCTLLKGQSAVYEAV